MKAKIYCLYNNKARAYMMPFNGLPDVDDGHGEVMHRIGEYLSTLGEIDNLRDSEFDLFFIGEYNTDTGKFENLKERQHIANCVELTAGYDKKCEEECVVCKTKVSYLLEVKRKFTWSHLPEDVDVTFKDSPEFANELIYICRGCYMEVIDGCQNMVREGDNNNLQQDISNEEESVQL